MAFHPVHEWFGEVAQRQPAQPAIVRADQRVSYETLDAGAWDLANLLLQRGLARGAMVVVATSDTVLAVTAIVAVLRAGGIFVPVDPRTPDQRINAMVDEIGARWFITDAELASRVGALAGGVDDGQLVIAEETPAGSTSRPRIGRGRDDACYVYFTSGSTGQPKGILGRLGAIDHFIAWEIDTLGLTAGVRVSQLITPSFDAFLRDIFTPLCAGGTICVPDSPDLKFDAAQLVAWLERERVALVHTVPSLFRTLLDEPLDAGSFAHLRHVLLSGEPLLPIDVKRWTDRFGRRIQLVNLYGPSETTMTKLFHLVQPEDQHRPSIPIGRPMRGVSAIVIDGSGRPCPPGWIGEIYLRTPYSTLGYFGRPELTRDVFVPNPLSGRRDDIVYKTGDLGRVLPDGAFELRGRRDHQVKIRGERVELTAIENAIRSKPGIRDVAVVDREDANATRYLCAYVVAAEEFDAGTLRDGLARELPPVMVPTAYVALPELPRTTSGKIDRHRLPAPSAPEPSASRPAEPPRTENERRLAAVFAEVLGLPSIGIHDNFFERGGHSLLATRVVARVRATIGVELPVRSLFEAPTVAGLARHVDALEWARSGAAADAAVMTEIEL